MTPDEQKVLLHFLKVVDYADPPDRGYIYDSLSAECCGCSGKADKIENVKHDEDCFQEALEKLRALLPPEMLCDAQLQRTNPDA